MAPKGKKVKVDRHYAYKCSGSCAAATDGPFKCGAEDCDKKGVALDKVERPVVYFCDAECKGTIFTPTSCGDKECSKHDVPLVAKVMCEDCAAAFDEDDEPHACEECTSVIKISELPEVKFSTDLSTAASEEPEHHHAYKCGGKCAAATDRPFKCGAEGCDKKGVALNKIDTPVVYFCEGKCEGKIFTPTNCGASDCDKANEPLVARVMCDECAKAYDEDEEPHACSKCISVIRVSKLPDEVVFTTNVAED